MKFTLNTTWVCNQAQVLARQEKGGRYMGAAQFNGAELVWFHPECRAEVVVFYRITKQEWLAVLVRWSEYAQRQVLGHSVLAKQQLAKLESYDELLSLVKSQLVAVHEFISEDTQEWLDARRRQERAEYQALQDEVKRGRQLVYESLGIENDPEAQRMYQLQRSVEDLQDVQPGLWAGAELEVMAYKKRNGVTQW